MYHHNITVTLLAVCSEWHACEWNWANEKTFNFSSPIGGKGGCWLHPNWLVPGDKLVKFCHFCCLYSIINYMRNCKHIFVWKVGKIMRRKVEKQIIVNLQYFSNKSINRNRVDTTNLSINLKYHEIRCNSDLSACV